jgi:GNAT superfamily N-acetyltransferase
MRVFRKLLAAEWSRLRDHLLRLSPADRHCRFTGHVGEDTVARYCRTIPWLSTVVVGWFEDGVLRGAAECRWLGPARPRTVELAVTVEHPWQDQGIGSELVSRALTIARNRGVVSVFMLCLTDNRAMQAIVRKHAGALRYADGDVEGTIAVPFPTNVSMLQEAMADWTGATGALWWRMLQQWQPAAGKSAAAAGVQGGLPAPANLG